MTTEEPDWLAILRTLDEPVTPPFEGLSEVVPGRGDGIEAPRDFDYTATKSRFDQLVEWLGEAFGGPCGYGHPQDSACFGSIRIPAEATRTRAKRTRVPFALVVLASSFGGLATYGPLNTGNQVVPVHPDDQRLIEEALDGHGYLTVPMEVLEAPYDGPNGWLFGPSPYGKADATWYIRFFDYL